MGGCGVGGRRILLQLELLEELGVKGAACLFLRNGG